MKEKRHKSKAPAVAPAKSKAPAKTIAKAVAAKLVTRDMAMIVAPPAPAAPKDWRTKIRPDSQPHFLMLLLDGKRDKAGVVKAMMERFKWTEARALYFVNDLFHHWTELRKYARLVDTGGKLKLADV